MRERGEPPAEAARPPETACAGQPPAPDAEPAPAIPALTVTGAPPAGIGVPPREGRVSPWNIANVLTVVRLVLVPLFVAFLLLDGTGWRIAALVLFLLASVTDQLDGWLARRYALITDFGKIADPIADKALIGAALVCLSFLGELPWWITVVILGREAGVTLLRFLVIRHGVIPASYGGKVKTVLQIVAIALYILPGAPHWARLAAIYPAVAVTLGTGVDYVVRAIRLRRMAKLARTS
ncbi:CDP-diacylglycerol--glycerol-3-phosphate 3-phosphatidyltransferase [Thermobispora bispora]|jgi:CDP-diacylglycerol---glycerol-3-phosphate 3-phosphatidyltransferase|uniref:CDP-diacylglycerol--glycerol-3-phosphate 3-phosphatidyltransferase n=1 Tax=Thermobispora bispora (strain ATCC 19993 / DSM 43833 / CBS 139.67 / JCM 10125 / KCTC 9307 / NBRC 14880 / R51) TaxID=469371 RepID=D6Y7Z9_THEBD|nr:CDP-diacylglycerol/glycerol-3-phosphate3-phospha tidyltransferase [Thermobispora bispora DSM 43833]MBO2473703.1 CDP-diacylglycerol--glycerol-3-phosphate 3-phosphatidyltransferase [Actinomycetales bacterium]MBX6166736.1 CDP-diacylglycerol--glycerol-3-phosphate 3-phosphatidyltransferase [Thermobispora bispora]QSI47715.1 CDP-diacylglycerol--glycerol-3-phosphate 3-phosphatidyltransferase [Thermobispora bispora]